MLESLTDLLKPIADWFNSLETPEFIVHWGHPFLMSKAVLSTVHAYLGSIALALLLFHAVLGLKLG